MLLGRQKKKILLLIVIILILKCNFLSAGEPGTVGWELNNIGDYWLESSPAIGSDGTVYVGSDDGNVYAIDPNGNPKWSCLVGHGDEIISSPALGSDGTVYIGSLYGEVYAIDPNGNLKWNCPDAGYTRSSPAIGLDGMVYIGSEEGYVHAIDPNGNLKWSFETYDWIDSSPAIGSDGTIYVGSGDWKLYAIDPNGNPKWSYTTMGYIERSSPAIGSDGTVYIGSDDGKVYAIDPNGDLKWSYLTDGWISSSPAIGSDGTIYIGTGEESFLYALDPNGDLKWRYPTGGWVCYSSPAIGSDGTIYVGSHDGNVYAIDPNGDPKWKCLIDEWGGIDSSPAIGSDGTIYICSSTSLFAIYSDSSGPADSPWPMFRHDVRHTGRASKAEKTMNIPKGWTMISLPVVPDNLTLSSLFPDAVVVYGYEKVNGYVRVKTDDEMEPGKGYWIFLNEAKTYTLIGQSIDSYIIPVNENGWHMIGGCSSSAKVFSTNCSIGVIYGYEQGAGYIRIQGSEFLEWGKGYWLLIQNVTGQAEVKVQI